MAATRPQTTEALDIEVKSRELGTLLEIDPSLLDPKYTYRWVHKSNLKIARQKARGYIIVNPAEEKILDAAGESPEAEDGTYTLGDVVLMKILKDEYRARRHAQKRKTDTRLKGPVRKFKRSAASKTDRSGQRVEVITNKEPKGSED